MSPTNPRPSDRDILDRLDIAINGDGTVRGEPGLVADVRQLREDVAGLKAGHHTTKDRAWTMVIGLFTGAAGAFLQGKVHP
jgi:hypothetical protein